MGIKSKVALAILALAVIGSVASAKGPAQNPPQNQPLAQQGPPNRPGARGFNRQGRGPATPGQFAGRRGFDAGPVGRPFGPRGRMGIGGRGIGRQGLGGGGFLNNPAIRQRLNITPAQTAKIQQQDLDFQKSEIRTRADLQVKRLELNELLAADNPNRNAIDTKLQEVGASQLASEKAAIDNQLAMRDILTPAQRQQLQQLRANGLPPGGLQPNGPNQPAPGNPRSGAGPGPGQRGNPPNRQNQGPAVQ